MTVSAVLAVCEACPVVAAAANEVDLQRLLDAHHNDTGHRLWAVSRLEHSGAHKVDNSPSAVDNRVSNPLRGNRRA